MAPITPHSLRRTFISLPLFAGSHLQRVMADPGTPTRKDDAGRPLIPPLLLLTTGPVPGPMRAAEDRPVSRYAYFPFSVCRIGTPALPGAIFILAHPLPSLKPGGLPGPEGMLRNFLTLGI
jgi:hypothetical protein